MELEVAVALLETAWLNLRGARLRKDWGEELRIAEERVLDAARRLRAVRRKLVRPQDRRIAAD